MTVLAMDVCELANGLIRYMMKLPHCADALYPALRKTMYTRFQAGALN